jgi:RNA polymerase sigma-70 factor (ECF subfamily)
MVKNADELIPTRASLLHRLKDWQDHSSWQDFFDTYARLIHNVARKAGLSEAEAKDVVQETVISVAKHMPTFQYDRANGSFKSWLLTMTRWRIADQLRKRETSIFYSHTEETRIQAFEKAVNPMDSSVDAMWEAEWENNLLEAALLRVKRKLDPQKYQIFDLYVNKNWPAEKVAKMFNVSVSLVYTAKNRVTEMVAEEVRELESRFSLKEQNDSQPENRA